MTHVDVDGRVKMDAADTACLDASASVVILEEFVARMLPSELMFNTL